MLYKSHVLSVVDYSTLCLWSTSTRTSWANWNDCKTRVSASLLGALRQLQSMSSNIWLESPPSTHDRKLHKLLSRARLSKRADTAFVGSFPTSSLLYSLLSKIHQLCLTSDRGIGRPNFSADWGGNLGPRMPYLLLLNWVASTISSTRQRGFHQSFMIKSPLSSSTPIGIAGSGLPQKPILLSPNFFMTSSVVLTLSLWPLTSPLTLPPTEVEHARCLHAAPGWSWTLSGMLCKQSRIWKL